MQDTVIQSFAMVVSPPVNTEQQMDTVAVLGCGLMGSGIAQVCVSHGFPVVLYGRNEAKVTEARNHIRWGLQKTAMKQKDVDEMAASIIADTQISRLLVTTKIEEAVRNAAMVIESVPEDLELKKQLFTEVQKYSRPSALLITNTSSIRLMDLVDSISNPSLFAGLHFFNPVPVLKLVEVVSTPLTSSETKDQLLNFCKTIKKTPISCKDTPGFIVNRLLVPYLVESIRMVERGDASMEDIDAGMRCGTNYPMGPLELCDYVGLDTIQNVMTVWRSSMPDDSRFEPCALLDKLVSEGKLGRKTKHGFYAY